MSATPRGAQQLLCVRCPDEVKSSSLGSASRDVIPNCEAEEITQKMMVLFCFVFLQMKHQSTEAYGVSWFPSADPDQKSFQASSSSRSLSSLSVARNPGGDGGRAAARGWRLLSSPPVCPPYPAVLSCHIYSSLLLD